MIGTSVRLVISQPLGVQVVLVSLAILAAVLVVGLVLIRRSMRRMVECIYGDESDRDR